ncbi:MAG: glucoamylase family protein [Pseudomonadota bacterium]
MTVGTPDRVGGDSLHARTLRGLQRHSFDYFVHEINRANGLVRDKTAPDWPASIAAMGMALTCYIVGAERGFIERARASELTLTMLRFLARSEQSDAPTASGYKGFYYHFLDMGSGRRAWRSELSSIDTALLIAGVLAAANYFDGDGHAEAELRELAGMLYRRVDWAWMCNGGELLCHGFKPEKGFLRYHWQGYDEALILYLLALGSPTHGIGPECFAAWCRSYSWRKIYGISYLHAGPLFVHQMSHIWCDFRGIRDSFMRAHDCDYFENSRRATFVQQRYALRNPRKFPHFGENCWGISASDGPGNARRKIGGVERRFYGYAARGAPFGPDDGTIAPWAVAASLPFAPEIVAPAVTHFMELQLKRSNPYGFKASFNPLFQAAADSDMGWVSPFHFGINEGPTVLMIENHRSDLVWNLMRGCKPLTDGLKAAGFSGGWLE